MIKATPKLLVIDNYDSFTWNLVDLLRRTAAEVTVVRNDEVTLPEVRAMRPSGILISPGPGRPEDSGVSREVVYTLAGAVPMLGICLGMQIMGEFLGMRLVHAAEPVHGKTSTVVHDGRGLFRGLPDRFRVMRYHSLMLDNNSATGDVIISASAETGEVMGIRHKIFNLAGVQFHPESILTEQGSQMIRNWTTSLKETSAALPHPASRER